MVARDGRNTAVRLHGRHRAGVATTAGARPVLEQICEFSIPEANQGIGVDHDHFYAVGNRAIAKYDKRTGQLVKKWQGEKDGQIIRLDSAMLMAPGARMVFCN